MNEGVVRRVTRFGLRGVRVGEASNPGPRYFLRRRRGNDEHSTRADVRDGDIGGDRPCRSQHRSHGAGVIATQVDSDTDADDERISSVPGDVVDALEADLPRNRLERQLKCSR